MRIVIFVLYVRKFIVCGIVNVWKKIVDGYFFFRKIFFLKVLEIMLFFFIDLYMKLRVLCYELKDFLVKNSVGLRKCFIVLVVVICDFFLLVFRSIELIVDRLRFDINVLMGI